MKLSQLSTDKALDVLCEITPYIANITADKALLDTLGEKLGGGKSMAEIAVFGAKKVSALAPIVLKDHKQDVFGVLSVINEKTVEEIGKQNILETMNQIREAVQDEELVSFFRSWQQGEKTE